MITIIAAAALIGCQSDNGASTAGQEAAADPVPERPPSLQDTLMVEGMPEVTTASLVRTPEDFPLPFSTYVPEGITVEISTGEQAAIHFAAAFDDVPDPLAFMHIMAYPADRDLLAARGEIGNILRTRLPADDPVDADAGLDTWQRIEPPGWALEAYSFDYPWSIDLRFVGRVILARYGTTLYHVLIHYPPEYGDGLEPRFDMILDQWRWEDTGLMLRG